MLATSTQRKSLIFALGRRFKSDNFEAGDYVIITPLKKSVTKKQWLSRPLKDLPNSNVNLNFGRIPHSDLIGAVPLGKVHTIETKNKLAKYICAKPSLEQWINFSQRKATPIYAFDAQAIVTLADIHLTYPEPPAEEGGTITPLQFLEAGTGHGSLTMAISKALHPANALAHYAKDPNLRGAVLHSIDCNSSHSITGKRTVKGFRRGMYSDNVEFSIADSPSEWVESEEGQNWIAREIVSKKQQDLKEDTDEPEAFLSGIFLDMPNYHEEMVKLTPYLKTGGFVIVFCPSITQIIDAIDAIAEKNEALAKLETPNSLHLEHERTIQLLDGAGGGLKEWDTRRAMIRATGKVGYSVRPKVGVRTVAGGFVAIWRKMGNTVDLEAERNLMENYAGKPDPVYDPSAEGLDTANVEETESSNVNESSVSETETETLGETKPKAENDSKETQTIDNVKPLEVDSKKPEDLKVETDNKVKLTKAEKEAMFPSECLSTESDVLEHERTKNEDEELSIEEQFPDVDLSSTESEGFQIEEATLIPHSVLHTVFRSCHGDPDVHAGYISNVKVVEFDAPEDFEQDTSNSTEPKQEEVEPKAVSKETSQSTASLDASSGTPKKWTKHSI